MHIGAVHAAAVHDRRVLARLPHVYLIARIVLPVQAGEHARKPADGTLRFAQALFPAEHRFEGQKPQPRLLAAAFAAEGVADLFAEHLEPAAHAEHGYAAVRRRHDLLGEPTRLQKPQVLDGTFRSGEDDEVGRAELGNAGNVAHRATLRPLEGRKVGEIGKFGQAHDGDVDPLAPALGGKPLGEAVFIVDVQRKIGNDAEDGLAREPFEHLRALRKEGNVAAEFVDEKALYERALLIGQERNGAAQLREDAAAVDIPHQQNGGGKLFREAHVHDVVVVQVQLDGAARALDDDDVVLRRQSLVRLHDGGEELFFIGKILARGHIADRLAEHDDLRADVGRGLQKDGIHAHVRLFSRRLRLHDLRAPHFEAVLGDVGIERHVLRFEGRNAVSLLL